MTNQTLRSVEDDNSPREVKKLKSSLKLNTKLLGPTKSKLGNGVIESVMPQTPSLDGASLGAGDGEISPLTLPSPIEPLST